MKDRTIVLSTIAIIILSILILITLSFNKSSMTERYEFPVCGNNICERGEEAYCLDCDLSCKSELCNSKINIICDNCSTTEEELLPTILENQIIVYDCLSDYYIYHPSRLIYHTISNTNIPDVPCDNKEGCYIDGGGFSEREGIKQNIITGLIEKGETEVTKKENVGFEVHELAHVFTYYGLGEVPSWFTEGISIYSESRVSCNFNNTDYNKLDDFILLYRNKKLEKTVPEEVYDKVKENSHVIGALYFGSLEEDYDCDKQCVAKILSSLNEYKKSCSGNCFENAKKTIPYPMNLSSNINDLRIPIITNEIIKQKSEEVIGKDLTELFQRLEIEI